MFAIIRNEDNLVVCTSKIAFTIGATSVTGSGFSLDEYNTSNVTQVEVATLPENYLNGCWSYTGNTWTIVNSSAVDAVDNKKKENKMEEVRVFRNEILTKSDKYVTSDRWELYTSEKKGEWATYRTALRDVPTQAGFPWTITWPTQPEPADE